MKFVLVDHAASLDLVSDRRVQSTSFEVGLKLVNALRDAGTAPVLGNVYCRLENSNLYLLGKNQKTDACLVMDLEQAPLFTGRPDDDVLVVFQRLLRFAIKYWDNLTLSGNEHFIPGSTKAVVFPFPMVTHSGYRIAIEREVTNRRIERRLPGKHLLVYSHGTDTGPGAQFEPDDRVFRLAIEGVTAVRSAAVAAAVRSDAASAAGTPVVAVTELKTPQGVAQRNMALRSLEQWMHSLTKDQTAFVIRDLTSPERIEGPAGTGKTLCLVLRAIRMLHDAHEAQRECHVMFVTHGEAMRNNLMGLVDVTSPKPYHHHTRMGLSQSLTITTLQSWCGKLLGETLSPQEYLDQDAMESKQTRLLYVLESLEEAMRADFSTHAVLMSAEARQYFEIETASADGQWNVAEMLQHEIGVIIKGRAEEDYDAYRRLSYLRYGLPLQCDGDRGFVFTIFQRYKSKLERVGQFDTDDVVLSAIGQLHTPIWRRRRGREGFDAVLVDETHLFNLNELSILHYMTRREGALPIAFAVDRSQAPGDRGITNAVIEEVITGGSKVEPVTIRDVFRCAPPITNLALSVTAAGATFFTNYFENPLKDAKSSPTFDDEQKSRKPVYHICVDDSGAVTKAIELVDRLVHDLGCQRADIVVIAFSNELFSLIERESRRVGRVESIRERGDIEVVRRARASGRFVLALPDYVGGLEFDGAVLVGVDDGRVPPAAGTGTDSSRHFLSFMYHSKLYVAITRARYRVEIIGTSPRGPSRLLEHAFSSDLIERWDGANR